MLSCLRTETCHPPCWTQPGCPLPLVFPSQLSEPRCRSPPGRPQCRSPLPSPVASRPGFSCHLTNHNHRFLLFSLITFVNEQHSGVGEEALARIQGPVCFPWSHRLSLPLWESLWAPFDWAPFPSMRELRQAASMGLNSE